jgi:hypothetical protein
MVCEITPSPSYYLETNKQLRTSTAKYPYMKTEMITYSLQAQSTSLVLDNLFQGRIPSTMTLSSGFVGDYTKNPFNIQNFNLNYINLMVNGVSVPDDQPLEPDYANSCFTTAYLRTVQDKPSPILPDEFRNGYNIYTFNIDPALQNIEQLPMNTGGNLKLELRFAQALIENVTFIMFASFPRTLEIDAARNIYQS